MSCCCIKILNLCNVPICGLLVIDQPAGPAGSGETNDHTLVLDYMETEVTLTELQTAGQNIRFDVAMLNENFQYTGKIYDSAGELVEIEVDGIIYDCVKFKTVMNVAV